jgi:hypothetical protein
VVYAAAVLADASGTEALAAHVDPEGAPRSAGDGGWGRGGGADDGGSVTTSSKTGARARGVGVLGPTAHPGLPLKVF